MTDSLKTRDQMQKAYQANPGTEVYAGRQSQLTEDMADISWSDSIVLMTPHGPIRINVLRHGTIQVSVAEGSTFGKVLKCRNTAVPNTVPEQATSFTINITDRPRLTKEDLATELIHRAATETRIQFMPPSSKV